MSRRYRTVPAAVRPLDTDQAYRYTIVLDRGFPVRNEITAENAPAALDSAVLTRPQAWLDEHESNKLMVYAHSGLNSEGASITRIRAIAPYALNNGIYPLFLTWRSGAMKTVSDLVEEWFAKIGFGERGAGPATAWLDRLSERTDRMLEPVLRSPGGAMWGQMKLNAQRASENNQGGVKLMVQRLAQLKAQRPGLEIHLIGHSAGAIVVGAMLDCLSKAGLPVATLRLLAPACTARFALDHYAPAVAGGKIDARHLHIHVLSDKNERDDAGGPYRKSLLYLVSRSFEDTHKMPLLGMKNCFNANSVAASAEDDLWATDRISDARDWQTFWNGLGQANNLHELTEPRVSTGSGSIEASHGCFDNAVGIMGDALGYIVNPNAPSKIKIHQLDY